MRRNLPVTQREKLFSENLDLISTTTPTGVITYANEDFCQVAGFTSSELVGQAHNIVRHPDMPQAAFQGMWARLKAGKSWLGLVKNRCKNGDHYWVSAFVTPIIENGKITEYQSVRVKPKSSQLKRAQKIYDRLNRKQVIWPLALPQPSLGARLILIALATLAPIAGYQLSQDFSIGLLLAWTASLAALSGGLWAGTARLRRLVRNTRTIVDDPLAQYIFQGRVNDISQLALALKVKDEESRAVIARTLVSEQPITEAAQRCMELGISSQEKIQRKLDEMEQVATAINQMSASIQEVSQSAMQTAESARQAQEAVSQGSSLIDESTSAIRSLTEELDKVATQIRDLHHRSSRIDSVVNVIGEIADQTNLLALNAAIEAARAGEQGRGFAVVADEVRALARRTQESTTEIQQLIDELQSGTQTAVEQVAQGETLSRDCVEKSDQVQEAFTHIAHQIDGINQMGEQISAATEQQSTVAEDINRKIHHLYELTREATGISLDTRNMSEQLNQSLDEQHQLLKQMLHQFYDRSNKLQDS